MLIGIDASRATASQRTGTEEYSLRLIRELGGLKTAHRFRLYFNQAPPPDIIGSPLGLRADRGHEGDEPGVEQRVIPFPRLWTHVRLSWEMARRPPDLLFVPSHVVPLVHPPRTVATVHDLGFLYHPEAHTLSQNAYLRWSTRHNARAATRILADSEATRQDLVRHYGTPQDKVAVVYPGRDEALTPVADPALLAATRARYGLAGPYLLYIGTLQPRKNLARLVQAFAELLRSADPGSDAWAQDLQLLLAGKRGWLYDDLVAQIRRLGIGNRILLPGYVPRADLAPLLSSALAFVFPSLYEGFGFPVLEAMACGAPVLCSNVSSLPEVAGDAALQANPLNIEAWVAAMRQLLSDTALRRELVNRGFRQVQRFSWRRCAQGALAVLEDAGRAVD
jgi:glycosyltransferase involved in cell wall biosynthesis